MSLLPITVLVLPALLAPGALISTQQPAPDAGRGKERGRLVLPRPAPQEEPTPVEPEEPAVEQAASWWGTPANRYEEVFARFEGEARHEEEIYKAYLEQLTGYGLKVRPTALKGLDAPHPPTVILAARLLEYIGQADEDVEPLVATASSVGAVDASVACLETALRLNGGWLPASAVSLLDHPKRGIRIAAEARLGRQPHESHQKPLLQRLRFGRDTDVRLRAVRLLAAFRKNAEVQPALLEALQETSVPVAFSAAEILAGTGTPEDQEFLRRQILQAEPTPELAYLIYGVLWQQEQLGLLLVDEEMVPWMRRALLQPDPFLSGAAAAALAEFHFRAARETGLEDLERDLAHALVRAVGGVSFYPQYARFSPLAERSLERITGESFEEEGRDAWVQWLAANHESFRAVRGVLLFEPDDYSRLQVAWSGGAGGGFLAGTDAVLAPPRGSAPARFLGARDLESLVGVLDSAGLLDVKVLPGTYGPSDQPIRFRIEIEIAGRRKRMTFRGPSAADWLPQLVDALGELYSRASWQLLAGPGAPRSFVEAHLASWDAASAEERARMRVELSRGRLAALANADLRAWAAEMAADPALEPCWDLELSREFLDQVPARADDLPTAEAALAAGLRQPAAELREPFLEAVTPLEEPLRSDLLLDGLVRLGTAAAAACLQDERLPVRVAAARALGRTGAAGRDALLGALQDPNPLVVKMAVRSLGELGEAAALDSLLPLAARGVNEEVRKEALWALGQLRDARGLEALRRAAEDEDAGVQIAAVSALAEHPGATVQDAFVELFPGFAGGPLEVAFVRALQERGAGFTDSVLRPHLESLDPVVARRAAILAGRLGDPTAAPFLMAVLADSPRDPELLDALAFTLCVDFRSLPDPAGVYAHWWRENGRAASTFYLHGLTGVDAPALYGTTPKPILHQVAQQWHQWLEGKEQG